MDKKDSLLAPATTFALFDDAKIRRERYEGEWYYSIVDLVAALIGSDRARKYWSDLKVKLSESEGYTQLSGKVGQLKLLSDDNKRYMTDVANTQTLLRIIQSIPSPKAEPIKQRLALLGNERVEEIDDPEEGIIRARQRAIHSYRMKGMSDSDIKQRLDMIDSRNTFTDLLKDRGIHEKEYALLTNIGYTTRAEMTAKEYKEYKLLDGKNDNLRDHMTKSEMLIAQIGEEASKMYMEKTGATGFNEVQEAIKTGSEIAKKTRESFKNDIGIDPITPTNRLTDRQKKLRERKSIKPKSKKLI